jgi:hypothetical protein
MFACGAKRKWPAGNSLGVSKERAFEVTGTIRRLVAIVLMTDSLNKNYSAIRDVALPWPPQKK